MSNARQEPGEAHRTAAQVAARAAQLAAEAVRIAEREEAATLSVGKIAHVGAAVAREFTLPAILNLVLDQTIATLGASAAGVYLADEDQRRLKHVGNRNIPEDLAAEISEVSFDAPFLTAQAASTRQARVVASLDRLDPALSFARKLLSRMGCGSMAALPLIARDRLIGVLTLAFAGRHDFTSDELAALDNCAEIFSFGIANALLYERERQLHALFESIGRSSLDIASALELRPMLQNIVDEARALVHAELGALGVADSADRPFEPWVFSGLTQEQADRIRRLPRPVGVLGAVAFEGRTLRLADVQQHPAFRGIPEHHPPITSFLGMPVRSGGRSVGNLYLANKRGGAGFTREDERAVEVLAAHAGAVVHQSQLRELLDGEQARFKAIVESSPNGVVFVATATRKIIANRRAVELVGEPIPCERTECTGRIFMPDGSPCRAEDWPIFRARQGEVAPPTELLIRRPDGKEVPVLVSASPVVNGDRTEAVVILFDDISVLKELQRSREEWASVVTHDLRQPLTVMTSYVGLVQRLAESPDPLKLYRAVEQMHKSATSLSRMIDDLADVSRLDARHLTLERRPVEVDSLVRDVVERQQIVVPDRVIALQVTGTIPKVLADPDRVEQVLSNLVVNALKYSDPGTAVNVGIRVVDDEVRILVANVGAGIAAEELPRIFDRYYRTHSARASAAHGLGLGLYIAKGLIEAHGGRIWAESTPGETTTFHFTLPIALEQEVLRPT